MNEWMVWDGAGLDIFLGSVPRTEFELHQTSRITMYYVCIGRRCTKRFDSMQDRDISSRAEYGTSIVCFAMEAHNQIKRHDEYVPTRACTPNKHSTKDRWPVHVLASLLVRTYRLQ
jgi:hypothetical protein